MTNAPASLGTIYFLGAVGAEIWPGWSGLGPGEEATMNDPLLLSLSLAVLPGLGPLLASLLFPIGPPYTHPQHFMR